MNEPLIRTRDLRKIYRLYAAPKYRFLDIFGLLRNAAAYKEHAALNGITLDIQRGEKVAIIGRNGAGKSTFLKLVTKVVEPTSGSIDVRGKVHALLQLGAGFHPDFTGRQNVFAYLAQLGIDGKQGEHICEEIVAFAEIEEYIDQPVKTYSTGMAVRLMFATSTAISPDLLVLDEVLSVGDAYFAQKSYLRMQELCDRQGTTLLFVTHDIFAAVRMCPRIIWFDRGVIVMDGDGETVVTAYDESIRAQEEQRLRLKKQIQLEKRNDATRANGELTHLLFEAHAAGNQPQPASVFFSAIALQRGDETLAELPLGPRAFEEMSGSHLLREASCWGEPAEMRGRTARPMINYGSSFHKVSGVFEVPSAFALNDLTIRIEYFSEKPCRLHLTAHTRHSELSFGELLTTPGLWSVHTAKVLADRSVDPRSLDSPPGSGIQGSGDIILNDFAMFDGRGNDVRVVRHGDPVKFRARFHILNEGLRERAQVIIVISRNGSERICKFMTSDLHFDGSALNEGFIEMRLPKMMLGAGEYSAAVEIAAEGYTQRGMHKYFSVDPDVYHCLTHALDFVVTDAGWIGNAVFEGDGEWSMREVTS